MTASQMRIAETIDAFYGDAGTKDGVSRNYKQAVEDLDAETIKALDGPYRTTVLDPITRFCAYFPDVNECIKKRSHKLLDYDALRARVKRLTEKPDKDATKLPRTEKEMEMAKVAYEQMRRLGYYHLYRGTTHEQGVDLAEKLLSIAPEAYGGPMSKVLSLAYKVAINQAIFGPLFNTYFFGMQSLLSGSGGPTDLPPDATLWDKLALQDRSAAAWQRIVETVPTSWYNSCFFWPFVTAFSFTFIPMRQRSPFAGLAAIGWQSYLGILNQRAVEQERREKARLATAG